MAQYTFDPHNSEEREAVKALIKSIEAGISNRPKAAQMAANPAATSETVGDEGDLRRIQTLLRTESGRLIYGGAARMFSADEKFSMQNLAHKIRRKPGEVLAWWRRLGGTHRRAGGELFERHEGRPQLYSLPPQIHRAVREELKIEN